MSPSGSSCSPPMANDITLWISIVALVTAAYAAFSARRSALASQRSADAADATLALRMLEARRDAIDRLAIVLLDPEKVASELMELPPELKSEGIALLRLAAKRNIRTPSKRFEELVERHRVEWEKCLQ